MTAPNFPITFNCAESLAAPTSDSKSMGVFMVVINASTILRCAEPFAGAKGMDSKNPKEPAAKTPKNLTWNVHVAFGENPKVDRGTFIKAITETIKAQLIDNSAAHDGVRRIKSPHMRGIWIGLIKSAPTSSMISKMPLPFACAIYRASRRIKTPINHV